MQLPLLSKSGKLQRLVLKATEEGTDEVHIDDLPGGAKAFEICAKFCYGMVVTLSPHNVVGLSQQDVQQSTLKWPKIWKRGT